MRALTTQLPEFGCLAEAPYTPSDSRIPSELNSKVTQIGRKVLPGVGIFLFLAGIFDSVGTSSSIPHSALAATWLSALAVLLIGTALKRDVVAARYANAAVSGAIAAVLAQAIVRLFTTTAALPTIHVILLMIAASSILLSWRWVVAVLSTSSMAWAIAVWQSPVSTEQPWLYPFELALGISVVIAALIHHQRLKAYDKRFREEMREAHYKESLRQVQSRYESAVRGANDGLWFWDLEADRIYVSSRWAQMVGYPDGAVTLTPEEWWDSVDPYYVDDLRTAFDAHLEGNSAQVEYKHRIRKQDGAHIWVLTRGLASRNYEGKPTSLAGSTTDVSHVIEIEQRLVNDALQDKLTGVANRHRLTTELRFAMEESRRTASLIAVIFLDLDDFKLINDNLGHPVGDEVLAEVAKKLWTCTRPSDTLARYGGDEFVLLLDGIKDASEAEKTGRRMQKALATPFLVDGHRIKLTASVGVSVMQPEIVKHEDLLRNADIAMYKSKSEGKGQLRVFNSEMHSQARRSWELNNTVRGLVERQECLIHYQPIVSLSNGQVSAAEALFRWNAPKNAQRPTSELILAAERTGSIIEIGEWVLRKVCADAISWQRQGLPPMRVSANVSAHQLRLPGFPETVESIVRDVGLDPYWLELELTETAFMHDIETVCANLSKLMELGIGLAVDDFGTGYSSLGYLAKFPLKTLKIDGSFVSGIPDNPQTAALTRGIISLAHSLGLCVTAEKVETVEQFEFLSAEGCDRIQGYLASPPVPAHKMAEIVQSGRRLLPRLHPERPRTRRELDFEFFRRALPNSESELRRIPQVAAKSDICLIADDNLTYEH